MFKKQFVIYAAALAAIFLLLRWMDYRFLIIDHAFEIYMGLLAVIFTLLGIWIALKLARPKVETVIVEKQVFVHGPEVLAESEFADQTLYKQAQFVNEIEKLNLSKRELEVLELMSRGMSNQEISGELFVSLNTVKTHTSNLFQKMDVKRRTQAVDLARRLGIIS